MRADQHRAVRVRDIHDSVIAGVLSKEALFIRIHDGSAVKRGTGAVRKNKHFRRAQSDHAKERTRLSSGEGQDDAKERANSSGNKQRHRREMLRLGNKFRVRVKLGEQVRLATGATRVH